MAGVTFAFATPVILDALARAGTGVRAVAASALTGGLAAALMVRWVHEPFLDVYDAVRAHQEVLAAVLALSAAATFGLRGPRRLRASALAASFALITFFSLAPAGYIGVRAAGEFSPIGADAEWDSYLAAHDMVRGHLGSRRAGCPHPPVVDVRRRGRHWVDATSRTSRAGSSIPSARPHCRSSTRQRSNAVRYPTTAGVLVVAERERDVDRALRALSDARASMTERQRGNWADGRLAWALAERALPPTDHADEDDGEAAARRVAQAFLDGFHARQPADVCRVLMPAPRGQIAAGAGGSCDAGIEARLGASEPKLVAAGAATASDAMLRFAVQGRPDAFVTVMRFGSVWRVADSDRLR